MARARQTNQWTHTASLMALLANVNRDPKRRAVKPMDFVPEHLRPPKTRRPAPMPASIQALKLFLPR
jgi:hypothetical protein